MPKKEYNLGKNTWHDEHEEDNAAISWYTTIGPGKISGTEQVNQYLEERCQKGEEASWADCHRKYPKISGDILGTGVGFYLSKRFIALHGGKIEITSPGSDQGSNVDIFLPL